MPDPFLRSAKTLKPFNREYVTSTCLGKGGFGQVYDGRRRLDNVPVVMKFLPKDRILNWGMFEDVNDHITHMKMLIEKLFFALLETCSI